MLSENLNPKQKQSENYILPEFILNMKLSLNWLQQILDISQIEPLDLVNRLTLAGFEIDSIEHIGEANENKDVILDIAVTANRGDVLSMLGLSREIAAIYNLDYTPKLSNGNFLLRNEDLIQFKSLDNCLFYSISILDDIRIESSPYWLREKLHSIGIPTENNIKDILNYILVEYGIPIFVYDKNKILNLTSTTDKNPFQIQVNTHIQHLDFLGRNSQEYTIENKALTTQINDFPISLTGFIETYETDLDSSTSSIVLEIVIVQASQIRETATNLNIKTEKSIRLGRGVDLNLIQSAYDQTIHLIKEISNGRVSAHNYSTKLVTDPRFISFSHSNLINTLGPPNALSNLDKNRIEQILKNLGFAIKQKEPNWIIEVPSHRLMDVEKEIDLIEEIGRIVGFDNFSTIFPEKNFFNPFSIRNRIIRELKLFLLTNGFTEVVHYSFQDPIYDASSSNKILLINPLTIDQKSIRKSIIPNLLNSYIYNFTQGNGSLAAFELGRVFSLNENIFLEEEFFSCIWGGYPVKIDWSIKPTYQNWFQAKNLLENIFQLLNIKVEWSQKQSSKYFDESLFHPLRWCIIETKEEEIGIFGQVNPKIIKRFSFSHNIYVFEINIDKIRQFAQKNTYSKHILEPYSIYPSIYRDINIQISYHIKVEHIIQTIYKLENSLLQSVSLFDDYRDVSVENTRRLSFRLFYRSLEENLTMDQVDFLTERIKYNLQKQFQISQNNNI